MNATAARLTPEPTRIGANRAPQIPMPATSRDLQRTAITIDAAAIAEATAKLVTRAIRSYTCVAATSDRYADAMPLATSARAACV